MSIIRRDPTSYGWTIYPEEEFHIPQNRCPDEFGDSRDDCPFCEGQENKTPPEIAALRAPESQPNGPGWRVRTIPDSNAVLRIEGQLQRRGEGIYDMMNGIGAHEVIIETPDHAALFSDFSQQQMRDVVWMYRERMRDLLKDPRFRYVQICRNYGQRAGARLAHPHSLVIALPVTPRWVHEEVTRAAEFWKMKERCVFCDIIAQDRSAKRIFFENGEFVALSPFAARVPFEIWILPANHQSRFSDLDDTQIDSLAEALRKATKALAHKLKNPPYNLIVHTSPNPAGPLYSSEGPKLADYYHWHIEIVPRLRELNGFEYGTGIYVNPLLPENAAAQLGEVLTQIEEKA